MAVPVAAVLHRLPCEAGCTVVRDGATTIVGVAPDDVVIARGAAAFDALTHVSRGGFWTGFCAYDLGRAVERVRARTTDDVGLPDVAFARFDARLVLHEHGAAVVDGDGPARALLEDAANHAHDAHDSVDRVALGPWTSSVTTGEHTDAVLEVLELLRAGECYQVNLTRRLTADGGADPVALHTALVAANPAPFAGLYTFGPALPGVAVVSASPELFLRVDGRAIETRPVKGTGTDAAALAASAKDRAENVMIVDLARNDLGRVCDYGSIHVPALCTVESHPGLYHLVSTVRGRLRAGVDLAALVRATFPPASVTGAPKPRVLQAIEDLEPVRRGVYCGAVGWIDAGRARAELAVAIRTFTIADGRTHLGVGGGIVADSRPRAEWDETELKAARLLAAVAPGERVPVGAS